MFAFYQTLFNLTASLTRTFVGGSQVWTSMNVVGSRAKVSNVTASGPTIWTSTYGLEPVLCNRLIIEPSGRAQSVHLLTQRFA